MARNRGWDPTAIRHIIWDWNGTLLDDAAACVAAVDALMRRRQLTGETMTGYRARVRFPVKSYYIEAGFDLQAEAYEALCDEFGEAYALAVAGQVPADSSHHGVQPSRIHADVETVLRESSEAGVTHAIVSASEHHALQSQVAGYGLQTWFSSMLGRHDNSAGTKDHLVREWVKACGYQPEQILYVGDTEHDFEAAASAGIRMALVSDGHVSAQRLHRLGVPVFTDRRTLWHHIRSMTGQPEYRTLRFDTVLGEMGVVTDNLGLVRVDLPGEDMPRLPRIHREGPPDEQSHAVADRIASWLQTPDVPLDLPLSVFGTGFRRAVWQAVREIPFGSTIGYGQLALRMGRPGSARAVAQALRDNPTPLVVPCHRVVGSDGTPTGFMGKRNHPMQQWLLDLERKAELQ